MKKYDTIDRKKITPENLQVSGKPRRTAGLKAFDTLLYPLLSNFAVFGISVVATYLTSHGDKVGGKTGKWFHKRGEWLTGKFTKMGMSEGQADMSKMVFFSFVDGSLMAPLIKLLEDRREKIAKRIDKLFGTLPEDDAVYKAEPKQTWGSVLLGRLATVSIVVPVAVVLDKIKINSNKVDDGVTTKKNLNDFLFNDPGEKFGKRLSEKRPDLKDKYPKIDIPDLFRISAFEAFYTSVCTGGLYVASRFIAKVTGKNNKTETAKPNIENNAIKQKQTTEKTIDSNAVEVENKNTKTKKFSDKENSRTENSNADIIQKQQNTIVPQHRI